ncbi:hypothetical protein Taro_040673 [Colocasia esculenta]|uniref:Uncharacterized protein n=1 Tax=Colocasia esculenta TaxID=4460 RepID=A0A843WJD8_COLES|nr:hypothetical protein [Colocasia esculenta]
MGKKAELPCYRRGATRRDTRGIAAGGCNALRTRRPKLPRFLVQAGPGRSVLGPRPSHPSRLESRRRNGARSGPGRSAQKVPVPMGVKMIKDVLRHASSASILSRLIYDNQGESDDDHTQEDGTEDDAQE